MAHSNSTTHYNLPQFAATDKPAWLADVNPAYSAIDAGMYAAQQAADSAQGDATQALSDASGASTAAAAADSKASGAVASIAESFDTTVTYAVGDYVIYNNLLYVCSTAVTTPGAWTGSTNWSRTTIDDIVSVHGSDIADLASDLSDLSDEVDTKMDADKFTIRNYFVVLGSTAWRGHYYGEVDITQDETDYGFLVSATVIDVRDGVGGTRINSPAFCQYVPVGNMHTVRVYSPTDANSPGAEVKVELLFMKP